MVQERTRQRGAELVSPAPRGPWPPTPGLGPALSVVQDTCVMLPPPHPARWGTTPPVTAPRVSSVLGELIPRPAGLPPVWTVRAGTSVVDQRRCCVRWATPPLRAGQSVLFVWMELTPTQQVILETIILLVTKFISKLACRND